MVCRQQMGTWEHVLPLFVPGYTVLFPTCSDNVLNVPLCGYTCTRILYPVTNSVPTYLRLERPRRRGRSKRPGTLFVTGYNMRVHTANCSPMFPTFDAPNKSQRFFLFPRGYMRVPVYPTYPVAKGICDCICGRPKQTKVESTQITADISTWLECHFDKPPCCLPFAVPTITLLDSCWVLLLGCHLFVGNMEGGWVDGWAG